MKDRSRPGAGSESAAPSPPDRDVRQLQLREQDPAQPQVGGGDEVGSDLEPRPGLPIRTGT